MIIFREDMSNIIKNEFDDSLFKEYSQKQLLFIEEALKNVITNYPISTIDCITYLRKHYNHDIVQAMNSITLDEADSIRFNCIYQSRILKEILETMDIQGYYVSYKARNFTTYESDALIKEAHTSIFVPSIINNKKCLIILEPGLKIDTPIYLTDDKYIRNYGNYKIEIGKSNNEEYPLYLLFDGVNKYSYNPKPHEVYQEFNSKYYTINPMKLLIPHIYKYLYAYRATSFSLDKEKRISLTIFPIEGKIMIYDDLTKVTYNYFFDEIDELLLAKILLKVCDKLDLDLKETIFDILFLKKIRNEFVQNMDQEAVKTYLRK